MAPFTNVTFSTIVNSKKKNINDKNKNTQTYQTIIHTFSNQISVSQITQLKTHQKCQNVQNVIKQKE